MEGRRAQRAVARYERTLIHDPTAPTPSPTASSRSDSVVRNRALTAVGIWKICTIAGWIGSHTVATRKIVTTPRPAA